MRAIGIMDIGSIAMVDIPLPTINEYECLVKMHACGFCNCTDTESVMNTHIHKDMPFPHIQGHEGVGEIVECGSKVSAFKIGERIVFPEGRIAPESGFYMCGCGHFSDYCIVQDCEALKNDGLFSKTPFADWPRKFPKEISYIDATMITPIRETLSAVRNFGINKGDNVMILGDGPSGFGLALFSKMQGANTVALAGHRDSRLEHAKINAKADIIINTHERECFNIMPKEWDIIIDTVGSPSLITKASHAVKCGGKVGLYAGLSKENKYINFHDFANNVSLHKMYSPSGDLDVHEEVISLILGGKVNPKHFYSHVLPMESFEQAMTMTLNRTAFKVVLDFDMK